MNNLQKASKSFSSKVIAGRSLNVMFADFSYFNRHTLNTLYTPLGIGLVAQYTKQFFGSQIDVSLYKKVEEFFESTNNRAPDIVGLSVYYWNKAINQYVVNRLRKMFGKDVIIILGGPCIDSDQKEQYKFLTKDFPGADAIIVNEGEIGFTNIIVKVLENRKKVFQNSIDGAIYVAGDMVVKGRPVGTTMDLVGMGSPYLSGLLDKFMDSDYQPLIQTSRFCPYTCAFCVSGKNRGKLRGYPIEQVKEELRYVSKKYADRPHHTMYLADENFGILKRDVEIAEEIKKCSDELNYPHHIFFYNDKRFTEVSRAVCKTLNSINDTGMCLSLQTENPDTLKAINRRNVTDDEIDNAIIWSAKHGIKSTTELIFGLPYDTRKDFIATLNRAIDRGFENVLTGSLFLMDGIELNRPDVREKHGIKTKFRSLGTNYGKYDGNFIAEYEEVVVSTKTFTYEDFLEIRGLSFMFFTVFSLNFHKWFFQFIKNLNIPLSNFFSNFIKPHHDENWPKEYLNFINDLKSSIEEELHDNKEEVINKSKEIFEKNNNDVGEPVRINKNLGARLIYLENNWIKKVMLKHLKKMMNDKISDEDLYIAELLLSLGERERINLRTMENKEPLSIEFDIINWKKNKYREPIKKFKMPQKSIKFLTDKNRSVLINSFQKRFDSNTDNDFYYAAQDFVVPRELLLHELEYN